MTKVNTTIEQIRNQADKLHQQLDEARAKHEASARKTYEEAAAKAKELAASLRAHAQEHKSDAAARFANAASSLEAAATAAKKTADAKAAEFRERQQETIHHVREGLQGISHGVAATRSRSAAEKQHA